MGGDRRKNTRVQDARCKMEGDWRTEGERNWRGHVHRYITPKKAIYLLSINLHYYSQYVALCHI